MIENGHYAELESIVKLTRRKPYVDALLVRSTQLMRRPRLNSSDAEEDGYIDDFQTTLSAHSHVNSIPARPDMRTFVFSATMSKDLQQNLKKRRKNFRFGPAQDGMSSLGASTSAATALFSG